MSAFLSLLIVTAAGANELCYVPTEQTAGWKRVDVPDDAVGLAAPADVDQFRPGEAAWLVEQDPKGYLGATKQRGGKMDYTFRVPPQTRRLTVHFVASLRGAELDATAYGEGRTFPLLDGHRVAENFIQLEWELPDIEGIVLRVHHHLRPVTVVAQWRTARWLDLGQDPSIPAAFRVTRSLYFRHPGGRTIELCDLPGQPQSVDRVRLAGRPVNVSLTRK
ncbi:MAG TPA: hypothetical protein VE618_10000 [Myxococcaceae bacterium]|nr:hypothetical protein [Myxococcaceae bacterium]